MKSKKLKCILNSILFFALVGVYHVGAATWKVPQDFSTIQLAIDDESVVDGDTIQVANGNYAGATVTKSLIIKGSRWSQIERGPAIGPFGVGFRFPSDGSGSGSTIENFRFIEVDLPIYAEKTDSVTIKLNVISKAVQGITNWSGSSWRIAYNTVNHLRVGNAGGIAIFIGDRNNVPQGVTGNVVLSNWLSGKASVASGSVREFRGAGVALFAAYSGGASKAEFITSNLIGENYIAMNSDKPNLFDFVGIELSEAVTTLSESKIFGNTVLKNGIKTNEAYGFVPEDIFVENEFFLNLPALPTSEYMPPKDDDDEDEDDDDEKDEGASMLRLALPDDGLVTQAPVLNPI